MATTEVALPPPYAASGVSVNLYEAPVVERLLGAPPQSGQSVSELAPVASATTDNRGVARVSGLAPRRYWARSATGLWVEVIVPEGTFYYGVVNAVSKERAKNVPEYLDEARGRMQAIKASGFDLLGQVFALDSVEADWIAMLDLMQEEGLRALPFILQDPADWDGTRWNTLGLHEPFLEATKDHPAMLWFSIIDEPFNVPITTVQLQTLYQQYKEIAPDMPIFGQYSKQIWVREEADDRFQGLVNYATGQCDVANIASLSFRNEDTYPGDPQYRRQETIDNHTVSRRVINRETPGMPITTTVGVFGGTTYYMPTVDELTALLDLIVSDALEAEGHLSGILFQTWWPFHQSVVGEHDTLGGAGPGGVAAVAAHLALAQQRRRFYRRWHP